MASHTAARTAFGTCFAACTSALVEVSSLEFAVLVAFVVVVVVAFVVVVVVVGAFVVVEVEAFVDRVVACASRESTRIYRVVVRRERTAYQELCRLEGLCPPIEMRASVARPREVEAGRWAQTSCQDILAAGRTSEACTAADNTSVVVVVEVAFVAVLVVEVEVGVAVA